MDYPGVPKIRNVNKTLEEYPLNRFPEASLRHLADHILYWKAIGHLNASGQEWEKAFATSIGARWNPSNCGLDDVRKNSSAWGVKTINHQNMSHGRRVRLISGRCSPSYSYAEYDLGGDPCKIGGMVLEIFNERVNAAKQDCKHLRRSFCSTMFRFLKCGGGGRSRTAVYRLLASAIGLHALRAKIPFPKIARSSAGFGSFLDIRSTLPGCAPALMTSPGAGWQLPL